ncbi:N-acetyltransferase [Microlunatus endophyticus]|uniref:N-acetyltransferase n=1 Tax=Microlunatus endophyticus TaxID=1716077 RepID=A0A917SA22_9ACTN|nr:GNAT family protein [Microlunatus endophyticus]GGL66800.1 N-acetyltransferase [Microlunatus endophyticus]
MAENWFSAPVLSDAGLIGPDARLRLEPLTRHHAAAFLTAAGDHGEQVFEHLGYYPPKSIDDALATIDRLNATEDQVPYAQIVAATGEFAGTTSFYEINPALRALAIGHTWIAHPWWRTWLNSTSKLVMLSRAFDRLGAERVVWHTDIRNTRSQEAIARLGAQREGVLRHHKIRRDGSWRDTVQFSMLVGEWPEIRARLISRVTEGSRS